MCSEAKTIKLTWDDNPEAAEVKKQIVFDKLLPQILRRVTSDTLWKSVRGVSTPWRDEATNILLERNALEINWKFSHRRNAYVQIPAEGFNQMLSPDVDIDSLKRYRWDWRTLDELNQLYYQFTNPNQLDGSKLDSHLPIARFNFLDGSLDRCEVLEFFRLFGHNIRELTVDVRFNPPINGGILRKTIFSLLPMLTRLEFVDSRPGAGWPGLTSKQTEENQENLSNNNNNNNINNSSNKSKINKSSAQLNQLKFLTFGYSVSQVYMKALILQEIKVIAPNLLPIILDDKGGSITM